MGQTRDFVNLRDNLRLMLRDARTGDPEKLKNIHELFGTKDRYMAGLKVNNACIMFSMKWRQKIINLWAELQMYFEIPEKPLGSVTPMDAADGPVVDGEVDRYEQRRQEVLAKKDLDQTTVDDTTT